MIEIVRNFKHDDDEEIKAIPGYLNDTTFDDDDDDDDYDHDDADDDAKDDSDDDHDDNGDGVIWSDGNYSRGPPGKGERFKK